MFSWFRRRRRECESLRRLPQQLVKDLPLTPEIEASLKRTLERDPRRGKRLLAFDEEERSCVTFMIPSEWDDETVEEPESHEAKDTARQV